jgi:hypothetical protein
MNWIRSLKPVTKKLWLYFTAGLMWAVVGVMLCKLAVGWLKYEGAIWGMRFAVAGVLIALVVWFFGFSKLAGQNINRIKSIEQEKICLFAFQEWTSYPLVIFMIMLGIFLRNSTFMPKSLLASLYIGIGGSLFLSSFLYFGNVWIEVREKWL